MPVVGGAAAVVDAAAQATVAAMAPFTVAAVAAAAHTRHLLGFFKPTQASFVLFLVLVLIFCLVLRFRVSFVHVFAV